MPAEALWTSRAASGGEGGGEDVVEIGERHPFGTGRASSTTIGSVAWYAADDPAEQHREHVGVAVAELADVLALAEQLRLERHRLVVVLAHCLLDRRAGVADVRTRRAQVQAAEVRVLAEEPHLVVGEVVQLLARCRLRRRARCASRP